MRLDRAPRWARTSGYIGFVTALGITAFAITRTAAPSYLAEADGPHENPTPVDGRGPAPDVEVYNPPPPGGVGEENPPGPDVTPEPGATPDTSLSWWHVPYLNQERMAEVRVQEITGITVGPWVKYSLTDTCDTAVSIAGVMPGRIARVMPVSRSGVTVLVVRAWRPPVVRGEAPVLHGSWGRR